ncbi:hypothetical protein PRZ48_011591 [Zasmidium cellare]|uniref:Transcription factor domain-containing protein n=1 Tax=Zasmidium cellare TaxID=395010 RepID=A0ABR0E7F2_ZASCE|nr:hypothetical protein PRZ48_011591 [Zasmidium cellare]
MVAVARDIGINHAKHTPLPPDDFASFSWHDFVIREELIRLFLWILLLDTAFVIFNNLPPRMAIKEMQMQLASSEACFQAATKHECFHWLQVGAVNMKYTLSSLCERLCSESMPQTLLTPLADLGPLNLFALTSALHSLSFQIQQCFGYDKQMTPIRIALDNWILIWQTYSDHYANKERHCPLLEQNMEPEVMWKRVGFSRYACEYWTLAKLIVDRISLSAFLKETTQQEQSTGESQDSLLEKYDDTSMKQVNDLITEFQRIII